MTGVTRHTQLWRRPDIGVNARGVALVSWAYPVPMACAAHVCSANDSMVSRVLLVMRPWQPSDPER